MKRYVTGFNGLRTIGVLTVILYHLWPNHVQGGFLGVVLFFVLSGYLVTDSLLREYEKNKKINIWKFWGRRLKRLYPLLVAIFLLVTPYIIIFQPNLWAGLRSNFLSAPGTKRIAIQIAEIKAKTLAMTKIRPLFLTNFSKTINSKGQRMKNCPSIDK